MKRGHYRLLTLFAMAIAIFDFMHFGVEPVIECTCAIIFAIEGTNVE